MKSQGLSIILKGLLILFCAAVSGCQQGSDVSYSNAMLDNGEMLLGNNKIPAISYSGYRTDTRTIENCPTAEQLKEDMKILAAMGIKLLRTYNTQEFPQTARMLEAIRQLKQTDPDFEMYVMIGAWIRCKGAYSPNPDHTRGDTEWNKRETDTAIEFAKTYPDIVKIIAVGNEAMVTWQAHFVPPSVILHWVRYLKEAREAGKMPEKTLVTTSDNWAALGGTADYRNETLLMLLKEIDYLSLHTYAFHDTYYDPAFRWASEPGEKDLSAEQQSVRAVQRAVAHQILQYQAVRQYLTENGIQKPIHIGETGWATLDNAQYGNGGTCAADEYKAKLFYDTMRVWTTKNNISCFYFEGFDEPWKSGGTAGSEGHFGLFTVDGKAKYMIWDLVDRGVFDGLIRGGNPIVKTYGGSQAAVLADVKAPALKKAPTP